MQLESRMDAQFSTFSPNDFQLCRYRPTVTVSTGHGRTLYGCSRF